MVPFMLSVWLQIDYLGLKGGCDVKESERIMAHIIFHDLSKTMNWRGINGTTAAQTESSL